MTSLDLSQRTLSFLVAALLLAPVSTLAAPVDTTTEAQGALPVLLPAPADELPTLPPVKPQPLLDQAASDAEELPPVPALPESTPNIFLLQLGAFPSEAMASEYWGKLKAKHSDLLGDLELKIAPVALPPDNKTVYRTQAGSIASREKAQSICARLRSTGADCFIVESVPGAPAPAPVIQEAQAENAALPVLPEPDQRRAPSDQEKPWETVTPEAPAEQPKPVEASKNDAPAVPVQLSTPEPVAVPDLPPAPPPPATAQAAPETPKETATPEMAWLNEPAVQTPPPAPKAAAAPKPAKAKTVKAAPKPQPNRTLVASADSPTVRSLGGNLPATALAPQATPIPPRMPREFPVPQEAVAPAPDYPVSQPHDIAPQATAAAVAEAPLQDGDGKGEVEVAEAIRVPLSQETQPVPGKLVYRIMPSDPQRTRTQWLDIGAFASESQAIGYWNQLRSTYAKHIGALRVRVTRPFLNPGRTSLRVGPLSSETDTASICTVATEQGLRCQVVTDLGVSSSGFRGGTRVSRDDIAQERYYSGQAQSHTPMSQGLYWVQLGTFPSEGEAAHNWSSLQSAHSELLGRMQKHVSVPRLSSSSRQTYRLRTGPFIQRFAAAELCDNLRRRAVSCVTVQGN
ncbi:MAG: SPOR domain-containing protein [Alphaproteobacteria bacterium]|nr:SPOR domain-containing protein [Alphaproteobacteria bacterium]